MRLALAALLLIAAPAAAQPPAECEGETCSGHGTCMVERDEPFCLCDEGYAAVELECLRTPAPPVDQRARRSSSIGARIVRIAAAEGGRHARQIGRDIDDEPGPMRRYIKIGALWCTDFVSWVYRAAGVPFTGGYHGGWHLTNNYAVREWFRRQDRWVARGTPEWERFQPRPGDYVRFHTRRYGHSAIVRYVANGNLYTIEGNARGGIVRMRSYRDYKSNRRIDGIGMVTQPAARRTLLR